ncbi:uncharacterized protein LOC102806508 [Saccoglossus kowalevskii]|uniref:Uncharacterized protein LOC102806508 n=1 Tax=Saccoglossus kowalevskii TaxID=10224 RepID=A0ABM0LY85_SACKO|nr:PREDICTED: uncharacterized protein LOC102806508 [Saccoglossus kowalevskii]
MSSMPHQKLPILPEHLLAMRQYLDLDNEFDIAVWACILFLRKSNMVPTSRHKFLPQEQLRRMDISFAVQGLMLHTQWSKTRQKHDFWHVIPVAKIPNSVICPVTAYCNMLIHIPASAASPAFVYSHSGSLTPLTSHALTRKFRSLVIDIGLDPLNYTVHGLRRGGATLAAAAGVSDHLIKAHGDWKSLAYRGYIALPPSFRFFDHPGYGQYFQLLDSYLKSISALISNFKLVFSIPCCLERPLC